MPQTQVSCPRCRQMIPANVEQLFDVTADPESKKRLLGRVSNYARCPFCKFEGPLATPIVYHDNEKELLLTHFPGELGLPPHEQEKLVGPLITRVTNSLPPEKRKGYLLRPQTFLTMQSLMERVLEADGITKDMLDGQQKRVELIQRLLQITTADVRSEVIKQESALIDEQFMNLLGQLGQAAQASGQPQMAQALAALQQQLLTETEIGRKLMGQMQEIQSAVQSLQAIGEGLTREKLLDVILEAPTRDRVRALVSLVRPGLDYSFFQLLTAKIDAASGEEKTRLEGLRESILEFTNELDVIAEEQMKRARAFLEELLAQDDVATATTESLDQFNDMVMQTLNELLNEAARKQDMDRMRKLQQIAEVLQAASAPPEYIFIEQMLNTPDDASLEQMLNDNADAITPELSSMMAGLMGQMESQKDQNPQIAQTLARLEQVYRVVLKFQMKRNMAG